MARKSRRVAAKQAELGQRKRRASKHHSGVEASLPAVRDEPPPVGAPATATATRTETAAPAAATATLEAPRPAAASTQRRAPIAASRTHNPYVWPEIKRIGVITALIVVILGVLTVVMG